MHCHLPLKIRFASNDVPSIATFQTEFDAHFHGWIRLDWIRSDFNWREPQIRVERISVKFWRSMQNSSLLANRSRFCIRVPEFMGSHWTFSIENEIGRTSGELRIWGTNVRLRVNNTWRMLHAVNWWRFNIRNSNSNKHWATSSAGTCDNTRFLHSNVLIKRLKSFPQSRIEHIKTYNFLQLGQFIFDCGRIHFIS